MPTFDFNTYMLYVIEGLENIFNDNELQTKAVYAMQYKLRTKIWIGDGSDNVVFGMGRVKILEAIDLYGSINAAAKELKMSYRAVWLRIKATEDRLAKQLVVRTTGGTSGGGSTLTAYAKDLIKEFKAFHRQVLDETDELYNKTPIARLLNE